MCERGDGWRGRRREERKRRERQGWGKGEREVPFLAAVTKVLSEAS